MNPGPDKFFDHKTKKSEYKSEFVVGYFASWFKIMRRYGVLTYVDLFSGQGEFDDGERSTPLMILDRLDSQGERGRGVRMHFYESNRQYARNLAGNIEKHPLYSKLVQKPVVNQATIDSSLVNQLPFCDQTFTFIDPYGYKGVSLDLLVHATRHSRSDCFFYFTLHGARRNFDIESQVDELNKLFGGKFDGLKARLRARHTVLSNDPLSPLMISPHFPEQHRVVLLFLRELLMERLKTVYLLPMAFEMCERKTITTYLILISKHYLAFKIGVEMLYTRTGSDQSGYPLSVFGKFAERKARQMVIPFSGLPSIAGRDEVLRTWIRCRFAGKITSAEEVTTECWKRHFLVNKAKVTTILDRMRSDGEVNPIESEKQGKKLAQKTKVRFT